MMEYKIILYHRIPDHVDPLNFGLPEGANFSSGLWYEILQIGVGESPHVTREYCGYMKFRGPDGEDYSVTQCRHCGHWMQFPVDDPCPQCKKSVNDPPTRWRVAYDEDATGVFSIFK